MFPPPTTLKTTFFLTRRAIYGRAVPEERSPEEVRWWRWTCHTDRSGRGNQTKWNIATTIIITINSRLLPIFDIRTYLTTPLQAANKRKRVREKVERSECADHRQQLSTSHRFYSTWDLCPTVRERERGSVLRFYVKKKEAGLMKWLSDMKGVVCTYSTCL